MSSGWRSCLWAIEEVRSFHWEPRRRSRVRVPYTPHLLLNKSIPLSRLSSDESYKKSNLVVSVLWSVRLGVRTQDFHSCNTGSIPVPTTNKFLCISSKQSGGAGVGQRPVKNSSLKIREGGFLVQVRITCEYISRKSEGIYLIPRTQIGNNLSEWKPYREQVMEWHDSVKVTCGGFSRVPLDSNIDNNGMHKCKKITSLMAFMTKV